LRFVSFLQKTRIFCRGKGESIMADTDDVHDWDDDAANEQGNIETGS
jgi:hypothetical protein